MDSSITKSKNLLSPLSLKVNTTVLYKLSPFLLGIILLFIYLPNITPGYTWISAGVDHFDFIYAAKYQKVPHSTGFPVYIIPANLIIAAFPNAHPAWLLAFTLSTIPQIINVILTFFITQKLATGKYKLYAPFVAALAVAGAGPILAQTFIVEVYTYSIMFALFTICFHVYKRHNLAAIFMGLSIGTHGLIITMMGVMGLIFIKTYFKRLWIILPLGILPYLYLPWAQSNTGSDSVTTLLGNNWRDYIAFFGMGSSIFWWGTLPAWELPSRLWDTFILLSTGFGLATLGLILHIRYDFKKYWWLWIIAGTTLYYWLTVTVKITHVHFGLAIPILAVLAGLGIKYSKIHPKYIIATSIIIIATIPFFWNIGDDIDPNLSAQTFYDHLDTLANDGKQHVFLNMSLLNQDYIHDGKLNDGTAIWWAILLYKEDHPDVNNIHTIFPDRYTEFRARGSRDNVAKWYRETLQEIGLNTPHTTLQTRSENVHIANRWFVNWNGNPDKPIFITEEEFYTKHHGYSFWVPTVHQLQLWLTADMLAIENPDWIIHLIEKTGTKDSKHNDLIYSRELIDPFIFNIMLQMYGDAEYVKGLTVDNSNKYFSNRNS